MSFRKSISSYCDKQSEKLKGELEMDESYFGGKKKGKRGRGAGGKAIVFGILERKGKVHIVIVPDVSADTLMERIKNKTKKGSVFYADTWKNYNSLHQYGKHNKINHKKEKYMNGHNQLMVLKDSGVMLKKDSINIMELIRIIIHYT